MADRTKRANKLTTNALSMFHKIIDKLERANAHHAVAAGQHFVAAADLRDAADQRDASAWEAQSAIDANERVLGKLTDLVS